MGSRGEGVRGRRTGPVGGLAREVLKLGQDSAVLSKTWGTGCGAGARAEVSKEEITFTERRGEWQLALKGQPLAYSPALPPSPALPLKRTPKTHTLERQTTGPK